MTGYYSVRSSWMLLGGMSVTQSVRVGHIARNNEEEIVDILISGKIVCLTVGEVGFCHNHNR